MKHMTMTLKQQRGSNGWTQQEMADAAGVDLRTIKRWEAEDSPSRRVTLLYESLLSDSGTPEQDDVDGSIPMSISAVVKHRPDSLKLDGIYADLLGSLPMNRRFTILIGGASGAGKSSVTLKIGSVLSKHGPVLYCSSEERIDTGTIGTRAEQVGVENADIDVVEVRTTDDIKEHLTNGEYSYCVIDSVNELDLSPADALTMMKEHLAVSFIFIAQADATEKSTIGGARWRHMVDIRLWCERDKEGRRIVRNIKNRFAPRLDELVVSGPSKQFPLPKDGSHLTASTQQTNQEKEMNDYGSWIITRLETDLASAQREIESLRTRLDDKNEQLRSIEMRLMRFEIEAETVASMEEGGDTLSDNMNSEKLIASLDKIAPIASVVGDLIRMFRPQSASPLASSVDQSPATPSFTSASPHDANQSNFIPGVEA